MKELGKTEKKNLEQSIRGKLCYNKYYCVE